MTLETSHFISTVLRLTQISTLNYVLNCDRTELKILVRINNYEFEDGFYFYLLVHCKSWDCFIHIRI